jgi:FixJ family two-component response regulator
MKKERVLLVDDEPQLLQALARGLRGRFAIETTNDPARALELVANNGPYAVLISDMRMPVVDGAALLSHALRVSPDTSRIMLTGNADQLTATRAVNEGAVFRFLNKPCAVAQLGEVIETALEHHRRLRGERELIEQTLRGVVELLSDALELVDPKDFGAAQLLRDQARWVARQTGLPDAWEVELAALMSQVGWIALPLPTRDKNESGQPLSEDERRLLQQAPAAAARLVSAIPRLEGVAHILDEIGAAPRTGAGEGERDVRGAAIVVALLRAATLRRHGQSWPEALDTLGGDAKVDPRVLRSLAEWWESTPSRHEPAAAPRPVSFSELRVGMVAAAAIESSDGCTLLRPGERISQLHYERLSNHAKLSALREPILVDGGAPAVESPRSASGPSAS